MRPRTRYLALLGTLSALSCETEPRPGPAPEPLATEGQELKAPSSSGAALASWVASADTSLNALFTYESQRRESSRAFQGVLEKRNGVLRHSVAMAMFARYAERDKKTALKDSYRAKVKKDYADAAKLNLELRSGAKTLAGYDSKLTGELVLQRKAAINAAGSAAGNGVLPLEVICVDYSQAIAAKLPSMHTEVPPLKGSKRCVGDLTLDAELLDWCRAAVRDDAAKLQHAMVQYQSQLSCLSARQLRVYEQTLVDELQPAIDRCLPADTKMKAILDAKAKQLFAAPILLLADQTRSFNKYGKPGLAWLEKNKPMFRTAALTPNSLLFRTGLYVHDLPRNVLLPVGTKAMVAPAHVKDLRGKYKSRYFEFDDGAGGETVNALAAFIDGFGRPCRASDLKPAGKTNELAQTMVCAQVCDLGKGYATSRASWGAPGFSSVVGTSALSEAESPACPTASGGGGSTGSGGGSGGNSGGTSPTVSGVQGQLGCLMGSLDQSRFSSGVLSCVSGLRPGTAMNGPPGEAPGGGRSCSGRPSVAQDDGTATADDDDGEMGGVVDWAETSEYGNLLWRKEYTDADGNTNTVDVWGASDGKGGVIYTVVDSAAPDQTSQETDIGKAFTDAQSLVAAANDPAEDESAPAEDTTTSGGGGGADAGAPSGGGGGETTATREPYFPLGEMDYCFGTDEEAEWDYQHTPNGIKNELLCETESQCREPDGPEMCDPGDPSCSRGCTGADAQMDELNKCLFDVLTDAVKSGTQKVPSPDPSNTLVNVTPDGDAAERFGLLGPSSFGQCLAGGVPDYDACKTDMVALCQDQQSSCTCNKPVSPVAGVVAGPSCELAQCNGNASIGEVAQGANTGLGACGCTTLSGGKNGQLAMP